MFTIKTLKSKITFVCIFLVVIIAMIGTISSFNVYKLGRSIDGLMIDNYRSINTANQMNNCIEAQDKAILQYILLQKKDAVDSFYNSNDEFYKWFNIENNNITIVGEKELVSKINQEYIDFSKSFSQLQDYESTHNINETVEYYNTNISPKAKKVNSDLEALSLLNEKTMFNGKNKVKNSAVYSLYIILIISGTAAILGLIISIWYTKKSLQPISLLAETIKSVKEGELNKQAPIINQDEIGMLAQEFNSMTARLFEFEKSTKGDLISEKDKSVAIVRSINDPLIVLDDNYKISLLNESCENLFGIKEESVINRHFLEAIKNVELYDYVFNEINNHANDSEKIVNLKVNSKNLYFNTTVKAVNDRTGKVKCVVILLKNVTQFKELERIRTDFIATISHELKTPLTSIMMGVGLITDKKLGSLNDKQKEILDTMQEEIEKLSDLVGNLLNLSRIQSDKTLFNIKPCTIFGITDNCIRNFSDKAHRSDINLYSLVEEDSHHINADPEKITWVLNNLISNALKHTNAGDEIVIGAYIKNNKMHVYVKDTGEGIPKEYLDKIFEKFVKTNNYTVELPNTGLGLFIAKEIIEAHGGTIKCESKIDEGSTFTFTLPLAEV